MRGGPMIFFKCPGCGTKLRVKPKYSGCKFRCPQCGGVVTVPSVSETRDSSGAVPPSGATSSGAVPSSSSSVGAQSPVRPVEKEQRPATPRWEPGTVLLDDYVLEKLLGAGGMADVYLARSRSTGEVFAVKRILPHLVREPKRRRLFLHELRNWIDLPDHPHLTACRFFRSVEDQVVIFAEYVEGGSLEHWIHQGRISTLEAVLDVAIQMAWGLDVAHRKGLVHQDVKPANVLMRDDLLRDESRLAKMTDFGLAQAWQALEQAAATEQSSESPGKKKSGMGTPAFCSPEQAAGDPISPRTDLWGWAITIVEMLLGKRTWEWGLDVPGKLERYCQAAAAGQAVFRVLPCESLLEVLRRCFRREPSQRWSSMLDAAAALITVYQEQLGRPYPRQCPPVTLGSSQPVRTQAAKAGEWSDPALWLQRAAHHAGRQGPTVRAAESRPTSRRIRAIEDLIGYDDALEAYRRLLADGRAALAPEFAALCREKARVHRAAGDLAGALVLLDRAVHTYQSLLDGLVSPAPLDALAHCLAEKAHMLAEVGNYPRAREAYHQAVAALQRQPDAHQAPDQLGLLADCYVGAAVTLVRQGEYPTALTWLQRAIELLASGQTPEALRDTLAGAFSDKAAVKVLLATRETPPSAGRAAADPLLEIQEAVKLYDEASRLYARLGRPEGTDPRLDQARSAINRGNALYLLADDPAALRSYDTAMAFLKKLDPDATLLERAVWALNRAVVLGDAQGEWVALGLYEEALGLLECLVLRSGRGEWAGTLAVGCLDKAIALRTVGDDLEALVLLDRALAISRRLVESEGRREFLPLLADCYLNRGVSLANRGHVSQAVECLDRCGVLWDEAAHAGRPPSLGDRALWTMSRGSLAWRQGDAQKALALFEEALSHLEVSRYPRPLPDVAADAAFCYLNQALVHAHQQQRRAAARALDRAERLLQQHRGLESRALLAGPVSAALLDFIRAGAGRTAPGPGAPPSVDPRRSLSRTHKRLIHLV